MQKIKIVGDGTTTRIFVDEIEIKDVLSYTLEESAGHTKTITIKILCKEKEVETFAEVKYEP